MSNDPSGSADRRSTPSSPPDWEAIARHLAGESSADEAAIVERWLDAHLEDRALVQRLDGVATPEVERVDVEAALARVHQRMEQPERARLVVERGGALRATVGSTARSPRLMVTVAAAAAAAAAVITISLRDQSSPGVGSDSIAVASARTYTTQIGKRDSIQLADGSRVILGPDSRLTVRGDYGTAKRDVELSGDAYFDVRHDAAKPFTVRVGKAVIEDLGTTFTVESDGTDATTVAVLTGSVRLHASGAPANSGAVLAAGDRGAVAADGQVHAYPQTVSDDAAWTRGELIFKEIPLSRVASEIHRWYGVELRVSDTVLLNKHVRASFRSNEPVDQVLKVIGLTLGVSIERHGDYATVTSPRGPTSPR